MRNVSFAVSVTRLRTPRIGPARPAMPVSSVTSRSIVWTTDSRGSTYPEGIVHRPFDGPYVLRTTRSSPSRTRNAPAPTVIGRVATFRAMAPARSPNEMALSQVSFLGTSVGHATEGHVHPSPLSEENLAAWQLRRVPRRPVAGVRGKQGGPVVRLPPGPPNEEGSNSPAIRAVRAESGVLSGRSEDRVLRGRGPPGLCRPRRPRRSHGENRRIPGLGERDRGRPRKAEALVSGRSGARVRVERPRPRGPWRARCQDEESPVPGPEPVGQGDAPLGPGRKADRVPGEPRWKRPAKDRLSRWQGRPSGVAREGLGEPGRLDPGRQGLVLPALRIHAAHAPHSPEGRAGRDPRRQPPRAPSQG